MPSCTARTVVKPTKSVPACRRPFRWPNGLVIVGSVVVPLGHSVVAAANDGASSKITLPSATVPAAMAIPVRTFRLVSGAANKTPGGSADGGLMPHKLSGHSRRSPGGLSAVSHSGSTRVTWEGWTRLAAVALLQRARRSWSTDPKAPHAMPPVNGPMSEDGTVRLRLGRSSSRSLWSTVVPVGDCLLRCRCSIQIGGNQ